MRVAKHHYAVELANIGAKVFFLSTPTSYKISFKKPAIADSEIENLKIINHELFFSYKLKFRNKALFHRLMKIHAARIEKVINQKIDIVWSFDLGNFYPFKIFANNPVKIYMPVDEPLHKTAYASSDGADILFSVTKEIVAKYKQRLNVPCYFINHGVADIFINYPKSANQFKQNSRISIGISGNFLRPDIDYKTLIQIVAENTGIDFHFWGQTSIKESNYSLEINDEIDNCIAQLKALKNTFFHGICNQAELAAGLHSVDAFLICYDIKKDYSRGTNYHKVLEYLATGKVIISNNITTYNDEPVLVSMTKGRNNNDELPSLFKDITCDLEKNNSKENQLKRIAFAANQSYASQIKKIDDILIHHKIIN